jgi:hypothetical protein
VMFRVCEGKNFANFRKFVELLRNLVFSQKWKKTFSIYHIFAKDIILKTGCFS